MANLTKAPSGLPMEVNSSQVSPNSLALVKLMSSISHPMHPRPMCQTPTPVTKQQAFVPGREHF